MGTVNYHTPKSGHFIIFEEDDYNDGTEEYSDETHAMLAYEDMAAYVIELEQRLRNNPALVALSDEYGPFIADMVQHDNGYYHGVQVYMDDINDTWLSNTRDGEEAPKAVYMAIAALLDYEFCKLATDHNKTIYTGCGWCGCY